MRLSVLLISLHNLETLSLINLLVISNVREKIIRMMLKPRRKASANHFFSFLEC